MEDKQKKLRKQLKALLTSGWTDWERKNIWEEYLEKDVKPYYPEVFEVLK